MVKQKDGRLTAKSLNILMERKLKIVKFMLYVLALELLGLSF